MESDHESPQLLVGADVTLTGDGSLNRLDDCTVHCTPRPLAASTVVRNGRKSERFPVQGSFLDDTALSVSSRVSDADKDKKTEPCSGSNTSLKKKPCGVLQFNIDQSINDLSIASDRSSLGLLASDAMGDLSASLVHVSTSPQKQLNGNQDAQYAVSKHGNHSAGLRNDITSESSLTTVSPLEGSLATVNSTVTSTRPAPTQNLSSLWLSGTLTQALQSDQTRSTFMDTPRPSQLQRSSTSQGYIPQGQGYTNLGHPVEIATGGMIFGSQGDLDMSVVDVEINEDELQQFDEEFSDIGDMDTTLAEDSPPAGCDLRTELLIAEQSMREEEQRADKPGLNFSIDADQTPTFLRSRPLTGESSPEESPREESRPHTTGQATYREQVTSAGPTNIIDPRFLQQAPIAQLSPKTNADESINFASSLRNTQAPAAQSVPEQSLSLTSQTDQHSQLLEQHSSQHSSQLSGHSSQQSIQSVIALPVNPTAQNGDLSISHSSSSTFSRTGVSDGRQESLDMSSQGNMMSEHPVSSLSALMAPSARPLSASSIQDNTLFPADDPSTTAANSFFKVPQGYPPSSASSCRGSGSGQQDTSSNEASRNGDKCQLAAPSTRLGLERFSPDTSGSTGSAFVPYGQESQRQKDWGDVLSAAAGARVAGREQFSREYLSAQPPHNLVIPDSNNTSLIDTDDEIAAVRQENKRIEEQSRRQRGVGSRNTDSHGSRPGLEGGSSEENETPTSRRVFEARQSAEGEVMTSPVIGDGGGGGDGSSGHGSDNGGVRGVSSGTSAQHISSNTTPENIQRTSTTSRRSRATFEEDNPDAQERIQPMGDDLLSEMASSQRHVRFVSPADWRGRRLSGASDSDDSGNSPGTYTPETQDDQESHLASHLLLPSSGGYSNSMSVSQGGAAWGSTSPGLGHWDPGDGQDNDIAITQPPGPDDGEDETDALDFTFSHKISFGNAGDFSQLQPSGSPLSDRFSTGGASVGGGASSDRRDSKDSHASFMSRDSSHPDCDTKSKPCTSEPSLDGGEDCVFSPAFEQNPEAMGGNFMDNPFDGSTSSFPPSGGVSFDEGFSAGNGFFGVEGGFTGSVGYTSGNGADFSEDDFMSADQALAVIAEDEKEIELENRFVQPEMLPDHNTTLGLPESWTFSQSIHMLVPSWEDDSPMRVSMGTFMASRSAALGSLDGYSADVRPSFGTSKIVTPPGNRRPLPLIQSSSLSDIHEQGSDDVRGSGVGSDIDAEPLADSTLQTEDLEHTLGTGNEWNTRSNTFAVENGPGGISRSHTPQDYPSRPSSATDTSANQTTAINISTVTNLIASSSAQANPEELAEMIMKMSSQKLASRLARPGSAKTGSAKSEGPVKTDHDGRKDQGVGRKEATELTSQRRPDGKSEKQESLRQSWPRPGSPAAVNRNYRQTLGSKDGNGGSGESISELKRVPSHDNMASSNSSSRGGPGRTRPLPPPINGHTKIPLYQWNDQPEVAAGSHPQGRDRSKQTDNLNNNHGRGSSSPGDKDEVDESIRRVAEHNGVADPRGSRKDVRDRYDESSHKDRVSSSARKESENSESKSHISKHSPSKQDSSQSKQSTRNSYRPSKQPEAKDRRTRQHDFNDGESDHRQKEGKDHHDSERSGSSKISKRHSEDSQLKHPERDKKEQRDPDRKGRANSNKDERTLKADSEHRSPSTENKHDHELTKRRVSEAESQSRGLPRRQDSVENETDLSEKSSPERWKSPRLSMMTSTRSRREDPYGESILWESTRQGYDLDDDLNGHQSTPKQVNPKDSDEFDFDPNHSIPNDLQSNGPQKPVDTWRRNLLPDGAQPKVPNSSVPTLLTNQSLLDTPFANKYLSPKSQAHVTFSSEEARPLQSISVVSDQFNVEDRHHSPRLQSVSMVSDQFNASELGQNQRHRLQSSSLVSDAWSTTDKDLHHKENQPPADLDGHSPHSLNTFPAPRTPLAFAKHRQSNTDESYISGSVLQKSIVPAREIMQSSRSIASQRVCVAAPPELRMPEVCCVGLSVLTVLPLVNPSDRWLNVHLQVSSLEVDGISHDPQRFIPFVLKEKVLIEPRTTEDVKVIFSPRIPGVYVGQLKVVASPVGLEHSQTSANLPTMVTLQAIAEQPDIQVLTEGDREVDFGALPWGSQKSLHVALINRGQASIPVRLVITSDQSSAQCFTFQDKGSGDLSIISLTRSLNVAPTVANYTLPSAGHEKGPITPVFLYFRSPTRQMDRVPTSGLPEKFRAHLEIEVDTPSAQIPIGSLSMKAAVGTARLHAPRDMEVVEFLTPVGTSQSRTVPLRNAGNLPLDITMEVTHWPDYFSVQPSHLRIEAGLQHDIVVQFKPTQASTNRFESLLLMFVEPGGSGYEISLCGQLQVPVPRPLNTAPALPPNVLLANKHFLAWGGVPLGRALQQSVTIQNNSDTHLKVRLQVRGDVQEFQLQSQLGTRQQLSDSREVMLRPREEYVVHILFAPSRISHFVGKLQLKLAHSGAKFAIPLNGYGGISSLVLEGVEKGQTTSYWYNIGTPSTSHHVVVKANVHNTGTRTAYVKGLCFRDLGCRLRASEVNLIVQPSEFCLAPDSVQSVAVVLKPSEKEVAMCLDESSIVSTVAFFYGDEVSRQKYRHAMLKADNLVDFKLSDSNPVRGVNFNVHYKGQERSREEDYAPGTPNDIELFYSTMSKTTLALIGEPEPHEAKEYKVSPVSTLQRHTLPTTTPIANLFPAGRISHKTTLPTSNNPGKRSNEQKRPQPEDWYIKPEQVVLTANTEDPVIKRIQVVNYSEHPLNFELLWPGRVLTVTPDQGSVPPRSSILICISANSTLRAKGVHLPWRGQVLIDSKGESKVLKVQVREDAVSDDSPVMGLGTAMPLLPETATPLVTVTTPSIGRQPQDHLQLSHKTVFFPDTGANGTSETSFNIINVSGQTLSWELSRFAPAYIKDTENGPMDNICRVTYTVFRLAKHHDVLGPGQQARITVYFRPREVGDYSQFWEVKSQTQGLHPQVKDKTKIELVGQGILECIPTVAESLGYQSSGTALSSNTMTSISTDVTGIERSKRTRLTVLEDVIEFPNVQPYTSSVLDLKVQNKDLVPYKIDITTKPPFKPKRSTLEIRKRHYMKLPVIFTPTQPGTYHSLLILTPDTGPALSVSLIGTCSN